jgi:hypothetical protein
MLGWVIAFVVVGAVIALFLSDGDKKGEAAAGGAFMGLLTLFGIFIQIILPIILIIIVFKSCF